MQETDSLRQSNHIAAGILRDGAERADGRSLVAEEQHEAMDVGRLWGLVEVIRGHCPAPSQKNRAFQIIMSREALLGSEPSQADAECLSGLTMLERCQTCSWVMTDIRLPRTVAMSRVVLVRNHFHHNARQVQHPLPFINMVIYFNGQRFLPDDTWSNSRLATDTWNLKPNCSLLSA